MGLMRGAGNAIVPPAAAEFIRAFVEVKGNYDVVPQTPCE
jgi:hypothetical protein